MVPPSQIGWYIMPVGFLITLWVLITKIKGNTPNYYLLLAISWTALAIALDFMFVVKMLKPEDGYYKLDVYVYYALTFALPLAVGWWKNGKSIPG